MLLRAQFSVDALEIAVDHGLVNALTCFMPLQSQGLSHPQQSRLESREHKKRPTSGRSVTTVTRSGIHVYRYKGRSAMDGCETSLTNDAFHMHNNDCVANGGASLSELSREPGYTCRCAMHADMLPISGTAHESSTMGAALATLELVLSLSPQWCSRPMRPLRIQQST